MFHFFSLCLLNLLGTWVVCRYYSLLGESVTGEEVLSVFVFCEFPLRFFSSATLLVTETDEWNRLSAVESPNTESLELIPGSLEPKGL